MLEPTGHVGTFAGRELHWREQAGDGPAVMLMSGCGLAMEYWRDLVALLPDARIVAYDRPGMGGTRWPGHMPTLREEVRSLEALLTSLGTGPAVLVAHSMASFHAEALARLHPELVAGVVLVDGSVEWYTRAPKRPSQSIARRVFDILGWVDLGVVAGLGWRFGTYLQSTWSFNRLGYGRIPMIYRDPDALAMATAESLGYYQQAWDLIRLRAQNPWPGVQTVLLTAGSQVEWVHSQARYAQLLDASQVVVEDSKHLMMLDRPDMIADAVRTVRGH